MSDLWFFGAQDMWASGGWDSPDPLDSGTPTWTWDVEFSASADQSTYARSSINTYVGLGDCYVKSGIVAYRTSNPGSGDTVHAVGQSDPDGVADNMFDQSVDSVTFGWLVGASGSYDICNGRINMEIWGI